MTISSAFISVYVMRPSDECWEANLKKRELEDRLWRLSEDRSGIEFPNVSGDFNVIYQVTNGKVKPRMDSPRPELPAEARAELTKEAERIRREDEDGRRQKAETVEF